MVLEAESPRLGDLIGTASDEGLNEIILVSASGRDQTGGNGSQRDSRARLVFFLTVFSHRNLTGSQENHINPF